MRYITEEDGDDLHFVQWWSAKAGDWFSVPNKHIGTVELLTDAEAAEFYEKVKKPKKKPAQKQSQKQSTRNATSPAEQLNFDESIGSEAKPPAQPTPKSTNPPARSVSRSSRGKMERNTRVRVTVTEEAESGDEGYGDARIPETKEWLGTVLKLVGFTRALVSFTKEDNGLGWDIEKSCLISDMRPADDDDDIPTTTPAPPVYTRSPSPAPCIPEAKDVVSSASKRSASPSLAVSTKAAVSMSPEKEHSNKGAKHDDTTSAADDSEEHSADLSSHFSKTKDDSSSSKDDTSKDTSKEDDATEDTEMVDAESEAAEVASWTPEQGFRKGDIALALYSKEIYPVLIVGEGAGETVFVQYTPKSCKSVLNSDRITRKIGRKGGQLDPTKPGALKRKDILALCNEASSTPASVSQKKATPKKAQEAPKPKPKPKPKAKRTKAKPSVQKNANTTGKKKAEPKLCAEPSAATDATSSSTPKPKIKIETIEEIDRENTLQLDGFDNGEYVVMKRSGLPLARRGKAGDDEVVVRIVDGSNQPYSYLITEASLLERAATLTTADETSLGEKEEHTVTGTDILRRAASSERPSRKRKSPEAEFHGPTPTPQDDTQPCEEPVAPPAKIPAIAPPEASQPISQAIVRRQDSVKENLTIKTTATQKTEKGLIGRFFYISIDDVPTLVRTCKESGQKGDLVQNDMVHVQLFTSIVHKRVVAGIDTGRCFRGCKGGVHREVMETDESVTVHVSELTDEKEAFVIDAVQKPCVYYTRRADAAGNPAPVGKFQWVLSKTRDKPNRIAFIVGQSETGPVSVRFCFSNDSTAVASGACPEGCYLPTSRMLIVSDVEEWVDVSRLIPKTVVVIPESVADKVFMRKGKKLLSSGGMSDGARSHSFLGRASFDKELVKYRVMKHGSKVHYAGECVFFHFKGETLLGEIREFQWNGVAPKVVLHHLVQREAPYSHLVSLGNKTIRVSIDAMKHTANVITHERMLSIECEGPETFYLVDEKKVPLLEPIA